MWFNRQPKNRRHHRGHVLDVKLRSNQVRATRMRLGATALALLFGTAFGFYVLWRVGQWTLNNLVYENRAFAVQRILVQTDGVISPDQLRRWAGVKAGQNIFALELATVKRNLEMVPLISFVSVERILPGTVRLRVSEREPVAQVNILRESGRDTVVVSTFHLDRDGFVMLPLDPRQRVRPLSPADEPLPLLTGVGLHELPLGRRLESPQVQAALQLIAEFAHSPMAGLVDLKSIYIASPQVLVVTTGQGSEITFGLNDLDRQMRRWREIHDMGQRLNKSLATLDLAVSNNIPASWHQVGITPGTTPKAPKTHRPKRKNV